MNGAMRAPWHVFAWANLGLVLPNASACVTEGQLLEAGLLDASHDAEGE